MHETRVTGSRFSKTHNQVPFHCYMQSGIPSLLHRICYTFWNTYLLLGKSSVFKFLSHYIRQYLLSLGILLELEHPDTTQSPNNPHTGKVMALLFFSQPFWQGSFRGELGRARLGSGCGCCWVGLKEIRGFGKSSTPKVSQVNEGSFIYSIR